MFSTNNCQLLKLQIRAPLKLKKQNILHISINNIVRQPFVAKFAKKNEDGYIVSSVIYGRSFFLIIFKEMVNIYIKSYISKVVSVPACFIYMQKYVPKLSYDHFLKINCYVL